MRRRRRRRGGRGRGRGAIAAGLAAGAAGLVVLMGAGASPALAFTATAQPPGATEGATFSATVATFTDGLGIVGCPPASQYSATITWGDGTAGPGAVTGGVGMLLGPCLYAVAGTHTYPEEGSLVYDVVVSSPTGNADTGPAGVVVRDAPLSAGAISLTATQGTPAAATVATFTDADPGATPTDYTTTVSWGDGTTSAGSVAPAPGGGFAVTATHTYAHSGGYAFSVAIADAGGSQASAGARATVVPTTAGPAPPTTGTPPPAAALRLGLSTPVLARGGTVVVGVRCPVAAKQCRGRLNVATVAAPSSRLPALRRAQALGTTLFIIPGGRRAALSVRPKRAVVALLRRAGSVRVAAYASSFDAATGRSQVASLTAKLQLPAGH
ncbi:MAG: hypothetical protein QOE27_2093 [Solirubrobacteraceae bacterium]|nr:hypothetical protein [Solirubrobacteraceae bacterium]